MLINQIYKAMLSCPVAGQKKKTTTTNHPITGTRKPLVAKLKLVPGKEGDDQRERERETQGEKES